MEEAIKTNANPMFPRTTRRIQMYRRASPPTKAPMGKRPPHAGCGHETHEGLARGQGTETRFPGWVNAAEEPRHTRTVDKNTKQDNAEAAFVFMHHVWCSKLPRKSKPISCHAYILPVLVYGLDLCLLDVQH